VTRAVPVCIASCSHGWRRLSRQVNADDVEG